MGLIRGRLRACHVRTVSIGRLEIQVWLSFFSSLPMESQALVFLQGPLWLQHSMLYFGDLKSKLFSKLSMQRPKRPFGEFITHPPSPPSFSTDDDSWRNDDSKGSLPDAGEEEAVRLPSVRLLCVLSSNASVCTSICKA